MKIIEYLGKISLQIYDLKLELEDIKKSIKPVEPKQLPTLNFDQLKRIAAEEAIKQTNNLDEAAAITGVSKRTIARIMSGEEL